MYSQIIVTQWMSEMKSGRKEWVGIVSGYKVTSEQEKVNSTLCSKINYTKYFKISRERH